MPTIEQSIPIPRRETMKANERKAMARLVLGLCHVHHRVWQRRCRRRQRIGHRCCGRFSSDAEAVMTRPATTKRPWTTRKQWTTRGGALAHRGFGRPLQPVRPSNLDECPDDWDPIQGVDGDEIRSWSGPVHSPVHSHRSVRSATACRCTSTSSTQTDPIDGQGPHADQLVMTATRLVVPSQTSKK